MLKNLESEFFSSLSLGTEGYDCMTVLNDSVAIFLVGSKLLYMRFVNSD